MSSTGNVNEHGMDDNQPEQQQIGEQAMDFQQLSSLLSDIEGQGHQVMMALKPIAEALNHGGNISLAMISHVKAQILKAHLQLDDLEQLLDSIC